MTDPLPQMADCVPGAPHPCNLAATGWRMVLCDRDPVEEQCLTVCEVFLDAAGVVIGWISKPGKASVHAVEGVSGLIGHFLDMADAFRHPVLMESQLPEAARDGDA